MEITVQAKEEGFDVVDLGDLLPEMPKFNKVDDGTLIITDLPGAIPGAQIQVPVKEQEKKKTWKDDSAHEDFVRHYKEMLSKIPGHTGSTTVGCERAIAHLKDALNELSRAVRTDLECKLDEMEVEGLRDQTHDMIDKLEEALSNLTEEKNKKRRKKSSYVRVGKTVVARINDGQPQYYVSVAQGDQEELLPVSLAEPTDEQVQLFVKGEEERALTKEAGTAKVYLFEDPFLSSITRILINAHVSAGRNIEEVYDQLKRKYGFTDREELSIQELLLQKGMPIFKDLGRIEEGGAVWDNKGAEWPQIFQA